MKVNQDQIQQIYTFTQKHYVDWYDVQIELVDHLANGIENQWESTANTSFDDALIIEFKKFGIFGFQDLVEEKTKALNKQYRKQVWLYLRQFFTLPKIMITLFCTYVLYSVMHLLDNKDPLLVSIIIGILSVHIFHVVKFKTAINKREKLTGKKWLFENSIIQFGGLIHVLNIGIWFQPLFHSNRQWTTKSELVVSIFIVLYTLILYVSSVIIPKKLKEKMSKVYPQYNVASLLL